MAHVVAGISDMSPILSRKGVPHVSAHVLAIDGRCGDSLSVERRDDSYLDKRRVSLFSNCVGDNTKSAMGRRSHDWVPRSMVDLLYASMARSWQRLEMDSTLYSRMGVADTESRLSDLLRDSQLYTLSRQRAQRLARASCISAVPRDVDIRNRSAMLAGLHTIYALAVGDSEGARERRLYDLESIKSGLL